ncbi:hypothetical protein L873DRAFT_1511851 [Choiromyces venosus 120613-1]|uniref:Uncharacterized protein n=1 Tax=Choiromyces venosus 120613-1 TaxID=1336337 RepID=A0A3N4J664_9PEZI|nr:hypothetical protein L873DRAFT_1511851 [Choiromyces venosus 120613-1]
MGDNTTEQRERQARWATSYSTMTIREAEERLGIQIDELGAVPLDIVLLSARNLEGVDADVILKAKEEVYKQIIQYIKVEGYPRGDSTDFNKANLDDLVYSIISPILEDFMHKTGRKIRLERDEEIISTNNETGGMGEFVVVDQISETEKKFVLLIQGKRSSVGEGMNQCLLSLKDMRDNNGGGEVYGFITTGETWQMLRNDDKEKWIKDYSALVDCMFGALSNGGILRQRWFPSIVFA